MAEGLAAAPGSWDAVAGHAETKARLQTLLREGRVPHALLFFGPRGAALQEPESRLGLRRV